VLVVGAAAGRFGAFHVLARLLVPAPAGPRLAFAGVLVFTALVSGLVNLDVAVVVAVPVALRVADRRGLPADWLTVACALTANATSFLLPTSNVTNLLVLSRDPLDAWSYLRQSWLGWVLVTALTVCGLVLALARRTGARGHPLSGQRRAGALPDLLPMFVAATAIRTVLGSGVVLPAGLLSQLGLGSLLAASANNLPAAAALHAVGSTARWAAVLATDVGPNVFLSGSVATLICRRIARDGGVRLDTVRFSLLGLLVLPWQLLAAVVGLHATGAIA
jgi:arsenical pump membrane protein